MALLPLVEPAAVLTDAEVQRYARHLTLPVVGHEGQRRLKNARVLVVGAGGLGSPVLLYLAAAGVGTIGVVDSDVVDESNLQRQVLHGTPDVGRGKTASARSQPSVVAAGDLVDDMPEHGGDYRQSVPGAPRRAGKVHNERVPGHPGDPA
jgi:hypothetical protein